MKKITTVLIAMLLLTFSVLAAYADQEGNARWCNIDSHGCYLNEEGGIKSYMHFWSEESCHHFMGKDDPCRNVVPFYTEDKYRMPLEPAPEPVVYKPLPKTLPMTVEDLLEGMTEEEIRELLEDVLPEEYIETVVEYRTIPVTLVQILSNEQVLDIMFPQGAVEFNGVMIVTNLDGVQEEVNQRLVSLEAAGSSKELMIPVYLPKEGFSQEDFYRNFGDFRPMTAELSESGKSTLLGGSNVKNSFLIPYETEGEYAEEMNSNLDNTLKENFVLAGYVSSSGVGVAPEEERPMEAKNIGNSNEESTSGSDNGQSSGGLSVQFSQNEFNKNDDSTSLTLGNQGGEETKQQNTLDGNLFNNVLGAMILNATGTFQTKGIRIVSGTPGYDKKTVPSNLVKGEDKIPDNGGTLRADNKQYINSVQLQSGVVGSVGRLLTIDKGAVSGELLGSSGGAQVISIDAGTLLTFDPNDLVKAGPVVVGGEGQEGKVVGKPLAGVILDGYKAQPSARHYTIPWVGGTQATEGTKENYEVHIYNGSLESENFLHKYKPFGLNENPDEEYLKWVKKIIGISDWDQIIH